MSNPEQFFESMLKTVSAYPVTVFRAALTPAKLFRRPPSFLTCSAATAVTYSFLIAFFLVRRARSYRPESQGAEEPSFFPSEEKLLLFAIVSIVLVGLQRPLLASVCGRYRRTPSDSEDTTISDDLAALLYPLSVGILLAGPGLALLNRYQSPTMELLLFFVVPLTYLFALFNTLRARFSVKPLRIVTATAVVAALPIGSIAYYLYTVISALRTAAGFWGGHH